MKTKNDFINQLVKENMKTTQTLKIGSVVESKGTCGKVIGYLPRKRVIIELHDENGNIIQKKAYIKNCQDV